MGKETRGKTDTEESLLDSSLSNYDENNPVSHLYIFIYLGKLALSETS